MANKNKNFDQKMEDNFIGLLYMTSTEVMAKEIAEYIKTFSGIKVELWEEMNVLELELSNHNTVDLEPLTTHFSDPFDASFIKNRNIHTIFSVNLKEVDLSTVKTYFEQIIEQFSGFLCADTEDFHPVYVGSSD